MSEAPHLLVEDHGAIVICTLNRPEKLNALTGQTMALFEQALHRFRDTPELKVMLIRATGRYFCSGADLRDRSDEPVVIDRSGVSIREKHRLKLHGMHQDLRRDGAHRESPSSWRIRPLAWAVVWRCRCRAISVSLRKAPAMPSPKAKWACCRRPMV